MGKHDEQLALCVKILIDILPAPTNQILVDSELSNLKQKDIAAKQQLNLSAVKSQILRGRQKFKRKLQACCDFEFQESGTSMHCKSNGGCSI